jgi:hypothetical protein
MRSLLALCLGLLLQGVTVDGFSLTPSRTRAAGMNTAALGRGPSSVQTVSAAQSPLFMASSSRKSPTPGELQRGDSARSRWLTHDGRRLLTSLLLPWVRSQWMVRRKQFRRAVLVAGSAAFFWLATTTAHMPPAHASSVAAPAEPLPERILSATSPSLDEIVDRYVQKYMFDDDTYDPVESVYREAYHDAAHGSYPKALREVTASALGQESGSASRSRDNAERGGGVASVLLSAIGALQKRGLSEATALAVLAGGFVIAGPSIFLVGYVTLCCSLLLVSFIVLLASSFAHIL